MEIQYRVSTDWIIWLSQGGEKEFQTEDKNLCAMLTSAQPLQSGVLQLTYSDTQIRQWCQGAALEMMEENVHKDYFRVSSWRQLCYS